MRKVFRDQNNQQYWDSRWKAVEIDKTEFVNTSIYPIKYADMVVKNAASILEAGCGTGRLYFHYDGQGKDVEGIEYSQVAVDNILKHSPDARVIQGNVANMPYEDGRFDAVLAFGLYHNIEDESELEKAFSETARVIKSGGKLVASVRCASFENNLIEKIVRRRNPEKDYTQFHRWHFDFKDLECYLEGNNMRITDVFYARNVSFLFKFDSFRSKDMKGKVFDEADARSRGFGLNWLGRALDNFLHWFSPKQFSNLLIVIAERR